MRVMVDEYTVLSEIVVLVIVVMRYIMMVRSVSVKYSGDRKEKNIENSRIMRERERMSESLSPHSSYSFIWPHQDPLEPPIF